jgi:hypothetical protein
MNVNTVNERTGQYDISTGVTEEELKILAINPKTHSIQFSEPLTNKEVDILESLVFSIRPDITLRVYGHYKDICDLTFIERIPSLRKISADCLFEANGIEVVTKLENLESLSVGIFNLTNFDFLNGISPNIKELYLHQTRSKKPSIEHLSRFTELEYLYLEGQQKGIESISNLKKLQKIVLRSISTNHINYLEGLQDLWSVDVRIGGIKNFDALSTLPKIKFLELWQVRDLSNLSFISKLTTLQNLFIQSLRQLQSLPNFDNCKSLRRIYLENLKGLKDLSSLKNISSLKEFVYVLAENQEPENIIPVLENVNVKSVFCRFGSDIKNNRFDKLAEQYNKEQYKYKEFVYE